MFHSCDDYGTPYDYYLDGDEYDWRKNNESEDCSRLTLDVWPNLTSTQPMESVVRIYCGYGEDMEEYHRPYDFHVKQAGNPNAGTYYVTAKNVVYNFNGNNRFQSSSYSTFFNTNIPLALYDSAGCDSRVSFSFQQSRYMTYNHNWVVVDDDEEEDYMSFYVYASLVNYSTSDIIIPYTVTVCGISSSATITLKAGALNGLYSISANPAIMILGAGSSRVTGTFTYTYGGSTRTYNPTISAGTTVPYYATLSSSNNSVAYASGSYVYSRAVGTVTLTSVFQGYTATTTVEVQNTTLSVSPSVVTFDCWDDMTDVAVTSNTRWKMTNKPSWVYCSNSVVTGNNSGYHIEVSQNTGSPREGTVTFQTQSGTPQRTVSLTVRQKGVGNVTIEEWHDGGESNINW